MTKLEDYLQHNPTAAADGWLWKRSAAAALEVTEKTLERAAKAGKLRECEKDRKVFYSLEDLQTFEAAKTAVVIKPAISSPEQTALSTSSPPELNQVLSMFGQAFQQINDKLDNRPESNLQRVSNKITLDIDELAQFSGFGKTQLLKAIHEAENKGTLQRYAGAKGRSVWKCADLDKIIESLPPTEIKKRQPPKKKAKGKF